MLLMAFVYSKNHTLDNAIRKRVEHHFKKRALHIKHGYCKSKVFAFNIRSVHRDSNSSEELRELFDALRLN